MGKKVEDGRKQGSGRGAGNTSRITNETRLAAMASGLLPHEWLLKVYRGEPISHTQVREIFDDGGNLINRVEYTADYYATFAERIDCAKAASAFYAPKLGAQLVSVNADNSIDFLGVMQNVGKKLPG